MVIFLDTYAIIEIAIDNPNYREYALNDISPITTLFNLVEVYFIYLKKFGEAEADKLYNIVEPHVIPINSDILKESMKFKLLHQKKRYSMADCIGYIAAKKFRAKFLTGDYGFKGMENVEFVK